jgi:hypothetical protein
LLAVLAADRVSFGKLINSLSPDSDHPIIDDSVRTYSLTCHPSVSTASEATLVTLGPGTDRTAVDLRVTSVPVRTVIGTVSGVLPDVPVVARLMSDDTQIASDSVSAAGHFVFTGVPVGQFILEAEGYAASPTPTGPPGRGGLAPLPAAPDSPTLFTSIPITVGDRRVMDVSLSLRPGARVTGRVQFDGSGPQPTGEQLMQIGVTLVPVDRFGAMAIPSGRVEADGTFRTASVIPGRYLLTVTPTVVRSTPGRANAILPAAVTRWTTRSAIAGGRDILDQPIELDGVDRSDVVVTLTDSAGGNVSGTVVDAKGMKDPNALIVIFPSDRALWGDLGTNARRVRVARTTRGGQYAIPGLPAGDYLIVAGTDEEVASWEAPGALDTLSPRARAVAITEGQSTTVDLRRREP